MVIGYKVKSGIWSILSWTRIPNTKNQSEIGSKIGYMVNGFAGIVFILTQIESVRPFCRRVAELMKCKIGKRGGRGRASVRDFDPNPLRGHSERVRLT